MKEPMQNLLRALICALVAISISACQSHEERLAAYFEKGKQLYDAGDLERARLELKNALQIDNKHAESWFILGQVEEREGEFRQAFGNYARAVELDPNLADARLRKAMLLVLYNRLDAAAEDIETVLAAAPGNADALAARATLRRKQGDNEGAEADALAALQADPSNLAASLFIASMRASQGRLAVAEQVLQKTIEANPDEASARLVLGSIYDAMGETDQAVAVLQELTRRYPEEFGYKARLANYLAERDRTEDAEQVLREGLAEAPDDGMRQRALLALIARQRGDAAVAAELEQLIASQPESASLRFMEAGLQLKQENVDGALATFERIIDNADGVGPDAIRARNAIAELLLKQGEIDRASALIETSLEEASLDADALLLRSVIAMSKPDYDQAIADLRAVLRERPERVPAWRLLARSHAARGELELAEEALQKTLQLQPEDTRSQMQLAQLSMRKGDADDARSKLESLVETAPDDPAVQQMLAQVQIAQRDWDALGESASALDRQLPDHPIGAHIEGVALQQKGQHAEAIAAFERSLQRRPGAPEPMIALVRSHVALGAPERAQQYLERRLEEAPGDIVALNLIAELMLSQNRRTDARRVLEQAVGANPKVPQTYLRLAQLSAADEGLGSAREVLQRGIDATEGHPRLLAEFAMLAQRLQDYPSAMEAYETLLGRYPESQVAANNLAMLLASQVGDAAALDRALELVEPLKQSDQALFIDTVGWVYHLRGDYQQAAEYLERANALQAGVSEIEYHLGLNHLRLGSTDKAREYLDAALADENFGFRDEATAALAEIGEGG